LIHGVTVTNAPTYYIASRAQSSAFANATGSVIYVCGSALGVVDRIDLADGFKAMLAALRSPPKIRAAWWSPALPPRRIELKPRRRFTRWCSGRGSARAARRNIRRRG
jgi:hypothetical protein